MSEKSVTNDLLYEVLKSIQSQVGVMREDLDMLKVRASQGEKLAGDILASIGGQNERLDRLDFQVREINRHIDAHDGFGASDQLQ